nr:MAG TPA: hypothetical protein [Caudoviricetes sp.]
MLPAAYSWYPGKLCLCKGICPTDSVVALRLELFYAKLPIPRLGGKELFYADRNTHDCEG